MSRTTSLPALGLTRLSSIPALAGAPPPPLFPDLARSQAQLNAHGWLAVWNQCMRYDPRDSRKCGTGRSADLHLAPLGRGARILS